MKKTISVIFFSLILIFWTGAATQAQIIDTGLQTLLNTLGPDDEVDVLVTLTDQVDIKKFKDEKKPKDKLRTALINELKDKKDKAQNAVKDFLKGKAIKITSFWIFNGLAVTATKEVIIDLANQAGIESIRLDDILIKSDSSSAGAGVPSGAPEWNLNTIRAPELWDLSYTGSGIVVAIMDTGVDANHQDLASRWRGGSNSWYDPNGEHATPYDYDGHGTQVLGVLVGGDATGTAIGVAPRTQWIAVKMFNDAGSASYSVIHLGFQWLLDPDDNSNTNDSADVVNNSWGFRQLINQCFTEFQPDIQTLKAAEIAVIFSGGNGGPYAYTSESPANYPETFAAGAVDDTLTIASFSGRGPSACDGSIFPEAVAPGVNVKTADLTYGGMLPNAYTYVTGTSIAAPHVSGAMALLLDAFPWARVSELESALETAAVDLGSAGADNDYGNGLIDVVAAHAWLEQNLPQCTDADADGYYAEANCVTARDCNDSDGTIYPDAAEIKHDGIDQDCNDYDLTIDIIKASYETGPDRLSVEATSDMGKDANLALVNYGAMKWNSKKNKWTISIRGAGGDPGVVTVSGIEGSASASIVSDNPGTCTDADSDGYYAEEGCGTAQDCNDTDATIYPGAPEIPDDGIDQDCDGSDLTSTCTDADGDGFFAEPECGKPQDCNDTDATIYPAAPETKHDGIDQDCNGYDLTIDFIAANYETGPDKLSVEATSGLGKSATLELVGYGPMKWNNKLQKWTISVRNAGGNPGVVTVSGVEGSETTQTTSK